MSTRKSFKMNNTFAIQFGKLYTRTPIGWTRCEGRHLEDLWEGGQYAHDEVGRLTEEFLGAAYSPEDSTAEALRRLEIFFLCMKAHWVRLNGLLRGLWYLYLPCQCTQPTDADMSAHFSKCEEAWRKFYTCSELLIDVKINTGHISPSKKEYFLQKINLLNNYKTQPL